MKYIRTYKIFESSDNEVSMEKMKDILIDLEDNGISFDIRNPIGNKITIKDTSIIILDIVKAEGGKRVNFDYNLIKNNIEHLVEYLKGHGFNLGDIRYIDSNSTINVPHHISSINTFKIMTFSDFYKLTFKFIKSN